MEFLDRNTELPLNRIDRYLEETLRRALGEYFRFGNSPCQPFTIGRPAPVTGPVEGNDSSGGNCTTRRLHLRCWRILVENPDGFTVTLVLPEYFLLAPAYLG